eukprot:g4800.t1
MRSSRRLLRAASKEIFQLQGKEALEIVIEPCCVNLKLVLEPGWVEDLSLDCADSATLAKAERVVDKNENKTISISLKGNHDATNEENVVTLGMPTSALSRLSVRGLAEEHTEVHFQGDKLEVNDLCVRLLCGDVSVQKARADSALIHLSSGALSVNTLEGSSDVVADYINARKIMGDRVSLLARGQHGITVDSLYGGFFHARAKRGAASFGTVHGHTLDAIAAGDIEVRGVAGIANVKSLAGSVSLAFDEVGAADRSFIRADQAAAVSVPDTHDVDVHLKGDHGIHMDLDGLDFTPASASASHHAHAEECGVKEGTLHRRRHPTTRADVKGAGSGSGKINVNATGNAHGNANNGNGPRLLSVGADHREVSLSVAGWRQRILSKFKFD